MGRAGAVAATAAARPGKHQRRICRARGPGAGETPVPAPGLYEFRGPGLDPVMEIYAFLERNGGGPSRSLRALSSE
jgi:hypothetical protein